MLQMKRSKATLWVLTAIAALMIVGGGLFYVGTKRAGPLLRPDDEETVQHGAALYARECASCHGANLQGQARWQERGADGLLPAPPHDASGHTWHHSEQVLFEVTRDGLQKIAGPEYKTTMPAFAGKLADEDIIAILSFIKSTWPPKLRQANDAVSKTSGSTPSQ